MKEILTGLLILCAAIMLLLAWLRIIRSGLPLFDALAWGLLALIPPLLGPFLVLAFMPSHRTLNQKKHHGSPDRSNSK